MPIARTVLAFALLSAACAPAPPAAGPIAPRSPAPSAPRTPPSDPSGDVASKIDPIFAEYAKTGVPGCAVGVYRAGEILFARGYGTASLEHDLPITKDTVFDIASVSKQFTAAAVLLLALDGKLSLEDDVRKYVPELPDYGRPIRLRHLLHHTSGLRDYAGLLTIAGFDVADATNDDDGLFALAHQKALNFPTGTQWSYSNSGYFLLSIVVRRATGKKLSVLAKERIFDPLGMKSTMILDDHTRVVARRATAYARREDGTGFAIAMSDFEQAGDGQVQTTIEDLARWDANFYEPKIGGPRFLETLRTPGKLDDGTPVTYAMGLDETTVNGVAREEHAGAWAGYRAELLRFPAERLTIACLCNVESADPPALADAIAKVLLPKLATPPAPTGTPAPNGYVPSPADLAAIVGAYYDPVTYDVRTLSSDGSGVHLGFQLAPGGSPRILEPTGARTFIVQGGTTRYTFEPATGATPARLLRKPAGEKPSTLQRFEPITLTATALAEYAGRYTSDEMVMDMQVGLVDGKLHAGPWGRTLGSPPFEPLVRDVFVFGGVSVRFERDPRGKIRGFVLGADRARGIRYLRR